MEILYANSRIQKLCTNAKESKKTLGQNCANVLKKRLEDILTVSDLEKLRCYPGHYHELLGNRKGQVACSIAGTARLIFTPNDVLQSTKPDGGLDWAKVTAVVVLEITDYHN
ncbi:hypothetical protein FACS1894170_12220 [Planctomycetales bacterium]|nr:hypothetical protein FACS1894170_12220 [Planctomycetales bacterium]